MPDSRAATDGDRPLMAPPFDLQAVRPLTRAGVITDRRHSCRSHVRAADAASSFHGSQCCASSPGGCMSASTTLIMRITTPDTLRPRPQVLVSLRTIHGSPCRRCLASPGRRRGRRKPIPSQRQTCPRTRQRGHGSGRLLPPDHFCLRATPLGGGSSAPVAEQLLEG